MIESSQGRVYHLARIHHHACGTTLKVDADSVEYMTRWMPRKRQEQPESSSSSCSMMCLFTVSSCLSRGPSTASREKTTSTSSREITGLPPSAMLRWARRRTFFLEISRAAALSKGDGFAQSFALEVQRMAVPLDQPLVAIVIRERNLEDHISRPERAASAPSNGIPSHCW